MKGKMWELAPIVIAAAVAFGFAVGRRRAAAPPPPAAAPAVPQPRPSFGPGDPTSAENFKPDPNSKPDPNAPADERVPADPSSQPDPGAKPQPAPAAH